MSDSYYRDLLASKKAIRARLGARMDNIECRIVAIHRVIITEDDLRKKFEDDPNYSSLSWDYLLELLERLHIFDLWFSDIGPVPHVLTETTQDNDEGQAPFDQYYFDETGATRLFADDPMGLRIPEEDNYPCRVRFFLHYVDVNATLDVDGRHLKLPTPTPLPDSLRLMMPYQPPN